MRGKDVHAIKTYYFLKNNFQVLKMLPVDGGILLYNHHIEKYYFYRDFNNIREWYKKVNSFMRMWEFLEK